MFTGIITATGESTVAEQSTQGLRIQVSFSSTEHWGSDRLQIGESIAVNGVCLTIEKIISPTRLEFFLSIETLEKTHFNSKADRKVNLERALRLSDRLSGHLVQGHVDGYATLKDIRKHAESTELRFSISKKLSKLLVSKGSIALDGISLTLNTIEDFDSESVFSVMIIPHTWQNTSLCEAKIGDHFNVELDVITKVVERLSHFK